MTSTNNILRKAGCIERISNAHHFSGFYNCFCLTAQYELPNGRRLMPSEWQRVIRSAISQFVMRHGALCSGVVGEDGQHPTFIRLNHLDLESVARFIEIEEQSATRDLALYLSEFHSTRWPQLDQRPGWNAILFGSATPSQRVHLTFCAHHAFMDATGGLVFHRELLHALQHTDIDAIVMERPPPTQILRIPQTLIFTPPVEELMDFPTSTAFKLQQFWATVKPSWMPASFQKQPPPVWTGNPITASSIENYRTQVHNIRVPAVTAAALVVRCRAHAATITGLLHAVAVVSLAKRVPTAERFLGHTPYSLRPWTGSSASGAMVNQTSDHFCAYDRDIFLDPIRACAGDVEEEESLLWQIAAFHRAEFLRERAQVPLDNDIASLLMASKDWHMTNKQAVGQRRPLTFEVSNLGTVDLGEWDGYENIKKEERKEGMEERTLGSNRKPSSGSGTGISITNLTFSQSAMVTCAPLTLSVASMSDGMTVSISWQPEAMEPGMAETFCQDITWWLQHLGQQRQNDTGPT